MGKLLIGTSGYDYPEWKGVFYPPAIKREEFLSYYSEQFNALELNFSYYAMPDEKQLAAMAERSGKRVIFSIKGNQQLTHYIEIGKWRDVAREFRAALTPLLSDNLLSSVLLQFPQSFHYEEETRRYLASLINEFRDLPLVVEFRHNSWQRGKVYEGLTERGAGCCSCDMPEVSKLPSFKPVITGNLAYMRFHGRNVKNWYGTNARERYDYHYTDKELSDYIPVLRDISRKAKTMQVFFNNHAKGNAAVNAKKLMILMAEEHGG
ncbi:MAG: DUF72 domain-containing protein [Treponema sp.]|jgi:uncharacterized protein YecE (DUF72 family)|nr:DUF72 domain-containing protein [Treponema sp.]